MSVAMAIHDEQLAEHGGKSGIRDRGLLESALARPLHKFSYNSKIDAPALAACYAFGIIKNHPFVDGNKRTAFVIMELFLELSGHSLTASQPECVTTFLDLAAGTLNENAMVKWVRNNAR